jgi:hypothetical protein
MKGGGINMYVVKTRNWHCKRWVKALLDISKLWGVERGDIYEDGDGEYYFQTSNKPLALATWYYFMLFYKFSDGWTYVRTQTGFMRNSRADFV